MPTLLVDLLGKRKRVNLTDRASIGRTDNNHIAIDHPAISRTHALIHLVEGAFVVEDVGSANGTMMDGKPVKGSQPLVDGARIIVGPATITFHSDDAVIETAQPEEKAEARDGFVLNCSCGAKLWVPEDRVGGSGKCRQCGATVTLGEKHLCSICQWEITADASTHRCPACGLTFHSECWKENLGCSAYGCSQVNALADPNERQPHAGQTIQFEASARPSWEKPFLAASVAASLLSVLAFGSLAFLVALLALAYLLRHRGIVRVAPLAGCIIICTIGLVAGIAISGYWWLGWTVLR